MNIVAVNIAQKKTNNNISKNNVTTRDLNKTSLKVFSYKSNISFTCKNIPLFELKLPNRKENLKTLKRLINAGVQIVDKKNTWISKETEIGKGTIIYPGCYIQGENKIGANNFVGPNTVISGGVETGEGVKILQSNVSNAKFGDRATIGPFALVKNEVKIGEETRIGTFVEIEKTNVGKDTKMSHLSYIGNAEIGDNVNIGGLFGTSNYNPITKEKSTTVIKDNAMIGGQVILQAPVKIGEGALVASKSLVTEDIPPFALAIGRIKTTIKEGWAKIKKETK